MPSESSDRQPSTLGIVACPESTDVPRDHQASVLKRPAEEVYPLVEESPLSDQLAPASVPLAGSIRPPALHPTVTLRPLSLSPAITLRPPATISPEATASDPSYTEPPKPRILDASGSFDFDELAHFNVPSTIPGSDDDNPLHLEHRAAKVPEPGQRVGRYLTEEVLGRGGMGLVLRARDDLLQREVAIKVILPQYLSSDPAAGLRFLREAEIVARLQHPHVIRVLDAGLDAGVAYLAFEYIEGLTYSAVRDQRNMDSTTAVDLMLPVISAVAKAHELGIVHGDLKPSNLILSTDYAGRPHPWVLDFGVSFFSDVEAGLDPMRKRISGTPGYMAPEWLQQKGVDGRADCFSLGCVLYELLAQKGPFAGITRLSEAVTAAKLRSYPALELVSPASADLGAVVMQALHPDPEGRFSSAKAMGAALLPFAGPEVSRRFAREF